MAKSAKIKYRFDFYDFMQGKDVYYRENAMNMMAMHGGDKGMKTKLKDNQKLYWFKAMPNFGDLLNLDVFRDLGFIVAGQVGPKHCSVVAIGSLLGSFLTKGGGGGAVA